MLLHMHNRTCLHKNAKPNFCQHIKMSLISLSIATVQFYWKKYLLISLCHALGPRKWGRNGNMLYNMVGTIILRIQCEVVII